jgi:NAD(P)-dependent dehydrogenase (short-subunit alcohol dehydrogenase family)
MVIMSEYQMPDPAEMAPATLKQIKSLPAIMNQEGKVAIVTGGTAGLGYNIVNRLCEAGAKVVIADYNLPFGEKSEAEFKALGYDVTFIPTDVRNVAESYACVDKTVELYGGLDILVNDAAVWRFSPFLDMTEELFDVVVDTDLKGLYFFAQAAARYMVKNGVRGKIVNVASVAKVSSDTPVGMLTNYNSAKGGVVSATIGMARELIQYGINVNCVCPGGMMTSGGLLNGAELANYPEAAAQMGGGDTPLATTPDEVALIVWWLTTDASAFMVGEDVCVDGGARYRLVKGSFAKSIL